MCPTENITEVDGTYTTTTNSITFTVPAGIYEASTFMVKAKNTLASDDTKGSGGRVVAKSCSGPPRDGYIGPFTGQTYLQDDMESAADACNSLPGMRLAGNDEALNLIKFIEITIVIPYMIHAGTWSLSPKYLSYKFSTAKTQENAKRLCGFFI